MSVPILKLDTRREIVLEAPRIGPAAATVALMATMLAVRGLWPGYRVAQAVFGLLALWALAGALRVHRLRFDLEGGTWEYRRGWFFAPPLRRGTLDDVAGVFVDRNEGASRLRSRLVTVELRGFPDGEGIFALGFPMGPRVAADKAEGYARRLGVEAVDRAAAVESPPHPSAAEESRR